MWQGKTGAATQLLPLSTLDWISAFLPGAALLHIEIFSTELGNDGASDLAFIDWNMHRCQKPRCCSTLPNSNTIPHKLCDIQGIPATTENVWNPPLYGGHPSRGCLFIAAYCRNFLFDELFKFIYMTFTRIKKFHTNVSLLLRVVYKFVPKVDTCLPRRY